MTPFSLNHQVAVVTGGAVNIGRGIAQGLAQAGAKVIVGHHSHREEAEALAMTLDGSEAIHLDVTSPESVDEAFDKVTSTHGGTDILVNNSGIFSLAPQSDLPVEDWDRLFEVNARGIFLCSRAAANQMTQRLGGAIINISSINALHPGFGKTAHYDASKGAVTAYTKSLAAELAASRIRVNAIAPGLIDSDALREHFPELVTMVEQRTPLQQLGTAEDVAHSVVFLASRAASHITGMTMVVDGGYLLT